MMIKWDKGLQDTPWYLARCQRKDGVDSQQSSNSQGNIEESASGPLSAISPGTISCPLRRRCDGKLAVGKRRQGTDNNSCALFLLDMHSNIGCHILELVP